MAANSKIEWCHHTFNPWWGCVEVSPACDHCYARSFAKRVGHQVWGKNAPRRFFGDAHWAEPLKWDRLAAAAGERHRVFCASMADVMERREDLNPHRLRLWDLIRVTPNLDWLLLTKRPQEFWHYLPIEWIHSPRQNVWLMTTVESQDFMWRAEILSRIPAVVRGISYEPALGPINLAPYLPKINWAIGGGESGGRVRPAQPDWFRDVRDQCERAKVAFLFKQWGEYGSDLIRIGKKAAGRLLDGCEYNGVPVVV